VQIPIPKELSMQYENILYELRNGAAKPDFRRWVK
jgi:hypothetical protein